MGLEIDSTWEEIISALKSYFPSTYYIYDNGNVYANFTGGYTASGSYTDYSVNNGGKLYFSSYYKNTSAHGFLHTVNPVKIEQGHTKLIAHVTSASQLWSFAWLYIGTGPTTKTRTAVIIQYDSNGYSSLSNRNFTIDVSSLTGNYYVGICIQANTASNEGATVYIDKIWIE